MESLYLQNLRSSQKLRWFPWCYFFSNHLWLFWCSTQIPHWLAWGALGFALFCVQQKIWKQNTVHPRKYERISLKKGPHFNRKYIFQQLIFRFIMLVFRGVAKNPRNHPTNLTKLRPSHTKVPFNNQPHIWDTPPKFNSSSLKNDAWKTTSLAGLLSYWVPVTTFRGGAVKLQGMDWSFGNMYKHV